MGKLAFVFAGQGAQSVGMGSQIVKEYTNADNIFNEASESLGFDVKKMIFNGDEENLKITENTQPAILTTSIACLQPLLEKGIKPDLTAGLSLGEYSSHVLSGSLSFSDAVKLVRKRGKYMQEAVPLGAGTMAAILGLDDNTVIECCKEASTIGIVEPANFNCPGQVVVAGEVKAIEKLIELATLKGAKRAMLLSVSAPFHCSMLKPAGVMLAKELETIQISEMKIPVVTNVTGDFINSSTEIKNLLTNQVSNPVLWDKCIRTMLSSGVDTFVEIGPGKVLSGFIKKISKESKILNVEDIESLNKTLAELCV